MSIALENEQATAVLDEVRPRREVLRRRLAALRGRVRRQLSLRGLAWTCATLLLLSAGTLVIDWLLRLGIATRITLLLPAVAALVAVIYLRWIRPLRAGLSEQVVADLLERRRPGIGERVAAVLQLPSLLEGGVQASPGMIRAAVLRDADVVDAADFDDVLDSRRAARRWAVVIACFILPAVFFLLAPGTARLWASRWLALSDARWPQKTYLSLVEITGQQQILVPRGESLLLRVESQPQFQRDGDRWTLSGRGQTLSIAADEAPQSQVPERVSIHYRTADGTRRSGEFNKVDASRFHFELPPVTEPLELTITADESWLRSEDWIGPIHVVPIDRPTVSALTLTASDPFGTSETSYDYDGSDLQHAFLLGTKFVLKIVSRAPLKDATLSSKIGTPPALVRIDERTYEARWTMREALMCQIELVGLEGGLHSKPYFVPIGLLKDRPPRLTLRSSGVGRRVTPQAEIPLDIQARDDFGVIAMALDVEQIVPIAEGSKQITAQIELPSPVDSSGTAPKEVDRAWRLSLSELSVAEQTIVRVRATAGDNNRAGSQSGASRQLAFQVVKPEELFYEILVRQRAQRAKFRAALESAKKQSERLAAAVDSSQRAELVRSQRLIARQVLQVANRLDATLLEMNLNHLGSDKANAQLSVLVIKPIRSLHAEEMSKLRAALDALARAEGVAEEKKAEAGRLQEEMVKKMRHILARMSQWESFVDVTNQLEKIIQLQQAVLEASQKLRKQKTDELFDDPRPKQ